MVDWIGKVTEVLLLQLKLWELLGKGRGQGARFAQQLLHASTAAVPIHTAGFQFRDLIRDDQWTDFRSIIVDMQQWQEEARRSCLFEFMTLRAALLRICGSSRGHSVPKPGLFPLALEGADLPEPLQPTQVTRQAWQFPDLSGSGILTRTAFRQFVGEHAELQDKDWILQRCWAIDALGRPVGGRVWKYRAQQIHSAFPNSFPSADAVRPLILTTVVGVAHEDGPNKIRGSRLAGERASLAISLLYDRTGPLHERPLDRKDNTWPGTTGWVQGSMVHSIAPHPIPVVFHSQAPVLPLCSIEKHHASAPVHIVLKSEFRDFMAKQLTLLGQCRRSSITAEVLQRLFEYGKTLLSTEAVRLWECALSSKV